MINPTSRRELSEAVLASIGAVAVESSYLENTLAVLVWHLLSITQPQGHLVTDDMRLQTVTNLFERLAVLHLEEKFKDDPGNLAKGTAEIKGQGSLTSRIHAAATDRNLAIHGYWFDYPPAGGGEPNPLVLRTTKKPRDGSLPRARDAKWLDALAMEFYEIRNDLNTFSMFWLTPGAHDVGRHAFEPPV